MGIRDYLKVDSNDSKNLTKINDFFDWVDNNNIYEITNSAEASFKLHGEKITIKTRDNLPMGFDLGSKVININFVKLNKMKYFDNKGNSHSPSLASVMAHELKHAEDISFTSEVNEKYENTAKKFILATIFVDKKAEGEVKEVLKGGAHNNSRYEDMLLGKIVADILTRNSRRTLEYFSKDPEFIKNVQNFELEPIRSANVIRVKYENSSPRSEDYLDTTRANLFLLEKTILNSLEKESYSLNPHPENFAECPISTKYLIAINQEKTTLKEAGVSPDADLSGCVLVASDNVAGNKEYRDSVISRNQR